VVKRKYEYSVNPFAIGVLAGLERVLPLMKRVFGMTRMKEIKKQKVANDRKIFSIYESRTDIIVKGQREVQFGHKINLGTGKGNLILSCEVEKGNPCDTSLYQNTLTKIKNDYGGTPASRVTDGGYASPANRTFALGMGIKNIVFNKIVESLKNISGNEAFEVYLKKWRSGIEAVISNLKLRVTLFRCNWKGRKRLGQKGFWSVIAYNIRVMTASMLRILAAA
jgi:IS5 family transposase